MLEKKGYDRSESDGDYKYLTKMAMDSVSTENAKRLLDDFESKTTELEVVQSTSVQTMWLSELNELRFAYEKYKDQRMRTMMCEDTSTSSKKSSKKNIVVKKKK